MITLHFHLQPQYKYELFHINFTLSLLFTTKLSSARQLKNSQNTLNADQSNIYSCVQAVTNVNNSHWLKNSVQLSGNPQCFFDLPNLVAFEQFILKKRQPKNADFGKDGFTKNFRGLLFSPLFRQTVHKN